MKTFAVTAPIAIALFLAAVTAALVTGSGTEVEEARRNPVWAV
jgi:FlaG/FlaF family flagellin (archaellin)